MEQTTRYMYYSQQSVPTFAFYSLTIQNHTYNRVYGSKATGIGGSIAGELKYPRAQVSQSFFVYIHPRLGKANELEQQRGNRRLRTGRRKLARSQARFEEKVPML